MVLSHQVTIFIDICHKSFKGLRWMKSPFILTKLINDTINIKI